MSARNTIVITGNIGKVNVLPAKEGREPATAISVAINESYKPKDSTEWVDKTTWAKAILTGDKSKNLHVGDLVMVKGKAVTDAYLNREGKAVGSLKVVNPQLTVLSRKEQGADQPQTDEEAMEFNPSDEQQA